MVNRLGKAPVTNGESVIFDFGRVDPQQRTALAENAVVRYELPKFGEVNERADPCSQESVELWLVWILGCPWVFAGEEKWCGPVGIGDWAGADGGEWAGLVFRGKGV